MTIYTALLIYSSLKGSPYVPTRAKIMSEIFSPAKMKKGGYLIELGSGDGRMLRFAAKNYRISGLGVDVNPLLVFWSRLVARAENLIDIKFKVENIFDTDMAKADYLYIFLMPDLIDKLTPKMDRELRKGTVVISHGFPIKAWKKKLYYTFERKTFPTYYYRIK
jgi:hypothetical protein